ncbi:unnamed protein product [Closterium sp. NIES-65]|nr:unnamed protein product [Closterium sp. NIES-65]
MGTSVAVCFAVLFLSYLDIQLHASLRVLPALHLRFIDDGLIMWEGTREEFEIFRCRFDTLHSSICFTWVISEQSMDFLDLTVFKGQRFQSSGTLDMKLFQKPMNRYLYLPFKSYHTRATKLGFIRNVMPKAVPGIGDEPPIPEGYNGLDEMEVEEEEGKDDVLEDEYA